MSSREGSSGSCVLVSRTFLPPKIDATQKSVNLPTNSRIVPGFPRMMVPPRLVCSVPCMTCCEGRLTSIYCLTFVSVCSKPEVSPRAVHPVPLIRPGGFGMTAGYCPGDLPL